MKRKIFIYWIFLVSAIVFEVIGTSFLKLDNKILAFLLMSFFIACSYYFLALAVKKIQVGLAYAIWELLGSILILLVSFLFFKEQLTNMQFLGIFLSIIGILMINFGEKNK